MMNRKKKEKEKPQQVEVSNKAILVYLWYKGWVRKKRVNVYGCM